MSPGDVERQVPLGVGSVLMDRATPRWERLVVEVFKATRGLRAESDPDIDLGEALEELQPYVHTLREHYRDHSRTGTVDIDYSGNTADAYLLAYVPGYIEQSEMVFRMADVGSAPVETVGLFCCGPCPEAVALVRHLNSRNQSGRLSIHMFDVCPTGWSTVREALLYEGCTKHWAGVVSYENYDLDLTVPRSVEHYASAIGALDLAVFQNFDNEIGHAMSAMRSNIERVAELLPLSSSLIMSDLSNSAANHAVLSTRLRPYGEVTPEQSPNSKGVRVPWPVGPIRKHLLVGNSPANDDGALRLIPRVGHDAKFLILKRTQPAARVREFRYVPQSGSAAPKMSRHQFINRRKPAERGHRHIRGTVVSGEVVDTTPTTVVIRCECDCGEAIKISTEHLELKHPPATPLSSYLGRRLEAEVVSPMPNLKATRRTHIAKQRQKLEERIREDRDVTGFILKVRCDRSLLVAVNGIPGVVPANELDWPGTCEEVEQFDLNEEVPLRYVGKRQSDMLFSRKARLESPMKVFQRFFRAGDRMKGEVVSVRQHFVKVYVAGVYGSIHISELRRYWVNHPDEEVVPGEELWMTYVGQDVVGDHEVPAFSLIRDHDRVPPYFEDEWSERNLSN